MALRYPQQPNFSRGVLTPRLHGRTDLDQFRLALKDAKNFLVLRHGALARRSGTQFVNWTKAENADARLIEFIFDTTQAYAIEMGYQGAGYFRFFANGGFVEDPMSPGVAYEIAHIYTQQQIKELTYAQSYDAIYIAHKDVPPQVLRRASETSWSIAAFPFVDGPYDALNTTATTLQPSATTGTITIGASSTTGINGGAGFTTADVGRWVRIAHGGAWGAAKITGINSTTNVDAEVHTAFGATTAQSAWRLGSWYTGNYPSLVGFYLERSAWANSPAKPSTIWLSKNGILDDFGVSTPEVETDPLQFDISAVSAIAWLAELDDLMYGTAQLARAIGPAERGAVLSSTNVTHRKGRRIGAKAIRPVNVGTAILYANSYGTAVREMTYNYDQDAYFAPEASVLSDHLLMDGIEEMTLALEPETTVWLRIGDGSIVSMIYEADQSMIALMPHGIAKAAADPGDHALVKSLACIPGQHQYDIWVIVERTIDGVTDRYIEVMHPTFDHEESIEAFFVDSGLEYSGSPATVLAGFDHLIGETLAVLADGAAHPTVVVDNLGQIELDREASHVVAGLPMPAFVHTLEVPQQEDGSLRGRKRKLFSVIIDLLKSGPVDIAQDGLEAERAVLRKADDLMDTPVPLHTGPIVVTPEGSWDKGAEIIVSVDPNVPLPALIRSITPVYDAEP
jgi:hypothetical protein